MTLEELEAENKRLLNLIEENAKQYREVSSGVGNLLLRVLDIEERLEKIERVVHSKP